MLCEANARAACSSFYGCHGLAAQSSYPGHIGQAVGHLYERGGHDGACQFEELMQYGAGGEVFGSLH